MTAIFFIDTNVLVYTYDLSEAVKQDQAAKLLDTLVPARAAVTITQVLGEFYVTATQKLRPPMPIE